MSVSKMLQISFICGCVFELIGTFLMDFLWIAPKIKRKLKQKDDYIKGLEKELNYWVNEVQK